MEIFFHILLITLAAGTAPKGRLPCNTKVPGWMDLRRQLGQLSKSLRIFNGENAIDHIPWQILLTNGDYVCGGTIISSTKILTAAHCVVEEGGEPSPLKKLSVIAGCRDENDPNCVRRDIENIIWNDEQPYVDEDLLNDYAILELKVGEELPLNDTTLQRACLPEEVFKPEEKLQYQQDGTKLAHISGWGFQDCNPEVEDECDDHEGMDVKDPTVLQHVAVPLVSNQDCQVAHEGSTIDDNMICAGFIQGGKDACQGDSGGPLVIDYEGKAVVIGIQSWGLGCGEQASPGVYARVETVLAYIKKATPELDINEPTLRSSTTSSSTSTTPSPSPIPVIKGFGEEKSSAMQMGSFMFFGAFASLV